MSNLDNVIVVFLSMLVLAAVAILSAKYISPFKKKVSRRLFDKLFGQREDKEDREQ